MIISVQFKLSEMAALTGLGSRMWPLGHRSLSCPLPKSTHTQWINTIVKTFVSDLNLSLGLLLRCLLDHEKHDLAANLVLAMLKSTTENTGGCHVILLGAMFYWWVACFTGGCHVILLGVIGVMLYCLLPCYTATCHVILLGAMLR